MEHLKTYVNEMIEKYPQHKSEIIGLFQLCLDEIEEGGSREHEIELCINDIKELINK